MVTKTDLSATVLDSLAAYNAKRDFAQTAEPSGAPGTSVEPGGNIFMVQKHAATRLHYDFRLELDGVMKSWAVTRGPSLDPNDKRLAVMTEDHPLDYAAFEGTIPKGAYGGGTVMLWDRGTWEPEGDPHAGIETGKLHFTLHGERMKGEWVLFRLKPRAGDRHENWLLRKVDDAHAGEAMHLVDTHMTSVSTGRGMAEIAGGEPGRNLPGTNAKAASKPGKTMPLPAFRPVQLATLADTPPAGDAWLHEVKYDGYRALLAVGGGEARAYTRKANDWTGQFAQVAKAAASLKVGSALIDGEIVALDELGMPSFSALQNAIKAQKPMVFFAFDLLEIDGADLTHLPLTERKARLKPLIEAAGAPFAYADHVRGGGEDVLNALCKSGYEGIVSKRADGRYSGRRTPGWLKIKCIKRQEFVIGGWKVSDKRHGFSSLLLGYYEGGKFIYAGRVGTGFSGDSLEDVSKRMEALAVPRPAFEKLTADARRGARWVRPELVAEVAFTEMTPDGSLRHPSFLGLRFDKPAAEVVFEKAVHVEDGAPAQAPKDTGDTRAGIKITNPGRPVFPDVGVTKMALVDYYVAMERHLMAELSERPLSLVRCPQGRGKYCFFQKHDSGAFPEGIRQVKIAEADGSREPYIYVDGLQGVVACLQMGTLEFHGWGSHIATVEKPDRLVFDLDPDPSVTFETVKQAAIMIRDRLASLGLETWPMLSGGKGVHVVLPIRPELEWPEIKNFCRTFAQALAAEKPDEFTAALAKVKRTGRIFIDYLRNQRGATAILPYSTRSREGAPVAAPVTWKELPGFETGHHFSVSNLPDLLKRAKALDAAGWARSDQSLLAALGAAS